MDVHSDSVGRILAKRPPTIMSSEHKKTVPSQSAEQKRQESEEQLSLLQTITRQVAAADDLSSALKIVLHQVCEKTGWALGQAWVPNEDGSVLVCDSDWPCGESDLQEFRVASKAMNFKAGVGLPGRVWQSKQPAWVEDVTNDPNFPRSAAARTIGLKTGVGIPILSGDRVIAVIEFFMRESRTESEQLVRVIVAVAAQLDLVMERKRAVAELSRINEILQLHFVRTWAMLSSLPTRRRTFSSSTRRPSACLEMARPTRNPSEWSQRYGLFLPDKVSPSLHISCR